MKGFMRGGVAKAVAFILILACAAGAVVAFIDMEPFIMGGNGYAFESDFENSGAYWNAKWEMISALSEPSAAQTAEKLGKMGCLYSIVSTAGESYDGGINPDDDSYKELPYWFKTEKRDSVNVVNVINMEIDPNSPVLVSTAPIDDEVTSASETEQGENTHTRPYFDENGVAHFSEDTWQHGGWGEIIDDSWHDPGIAWDGDWTVYAGMTVEMYDSLRLNWEKSKRSALMHVYIIIALLALSLALLIYLLWVCGRRNGDEDVHTLLIDRAPPELTAAVGGGASFLLVLGITALLDDGFHSRGAMPLIYPLAVMAAVAAAALLVATAQSLTRSVKDRSFASKLLSLKLIKLLIRGLKCLWRAVKRIFAAIGSALRYLFGHKISSAVMAMFAGYSLVTALMLSMRMMFLPLALFGAAEFALYRWLRQADMIQKGISEIRSGNTDYKIEGCTSVLMAPTADSLNSIGDAVKESVERETAAQRMRNELITNVSHDLKTPLTSIINYADLLTALDLSPKEANDYAKIVRQKGERLKKLTQDLFDISKAESGSETVEAESLDMALLLRQSLAELGSEIEKSGLSFVTDIPEGEVPVTGDGKKLSRVFENLLVNALKYSMIGTRVYVSLRVGEGRAVAEIKNISAEPMNFAPSEITERFVRGDRSRSTEGSGLGLAIARSYTELCGGRLDISVDGDLFKAEVEMKIRN